MVFVSILRCGAVSGFKDRVAGDVVDVATRCDADTANLCSESVGEVVAVEVERRDDVEISRTCQHLLQGDVSDRVFDDDSCTGFALGDHTPWAAVDFDSAEFIFRTLITPVTESTFGVFHDVALVHDRQRLAALIDCVLDRRAHETLGAVFGNGLEANANQFWAFFAETDFLEVSGEIFLEERKGFHRLVATGFEVDACVNVLGVFAENHHVDELRMLHGARNASEILHRAQANVKVEDLTKRHVERADAATDRSGEWAFDSNEIFAECGECVFRQPSLAEVGDLVLIHVEGFFASKHLEPRNFACATVSFFHSGIQYAHGRFPDVAACAVTFDERNYGMIRNCENAIFDGDLLAGRRCNVVVCHGRNRNCARSGAGLMPMRKHGSKEKCDSFCVRRSYDVFFRLAQFVSCDDFRLRISLSCAKFWACRGNDFQET